MNKEHKALVLKFGGSNAVEDNGANAEYLFRFLTAIGVKKLQTYEKLGLVIGGGQRVRTLQMQHDDSTQKDLAARNMLWEHATTLLTVAKMVGLSVDSRIPHDVEEMDHILQTQKHQVLSMNWVKAGQSTDATAMILLDRWARMGYEANMVILSNVTYIYTGDPKIQTDAKPIKFAGIESLISNGVVVNDPDKFVPGMNTTIDPVAVRIYQTLEQYFPLLYFGHSLHPHAVFTFLNGMIPHIGTLVSTGNHEIEYANVFVNA